jgi:bifunctional UDP-N-acetylglucosamine pyrophosphorylase/glucosamine-1-phosphate N-acetyltransferase
MEKITGVILAGGKGTRMNGSRPKVLMEIEGKPMIRRIVECFESPFVKKTIVVVGKLEKEIAQVLPSDIIYAKQSEPKGTLDAFQKCLSLLIR